MSAAADDPRGRDSARRPTVLDVALADLVQVRRDLGDIGSWLWERWPADLPMPYFAGRCHMRGNVAELWVQCVDEAMLERAAEVMGVEARADRLPGYRSAVRRFGRTDIVAWLAPPRPAAAAAAEGSGDGGEEAGDG